MAEAERGGLRRRPEENERALLLIALHNDHVNLGFSQGAQLPDPEGLLEGPGKMMLRHTKIAEPEDLEKPALRRLLEAAKAHRVSTGSVR